MYTSKKYLVSPFIIEACSTFLKAHSLGNRGVEDGTFEQQLTGLIGEYIVYYHLKKTKPDLSKKEDGFDGGIDVIHNGLRIDVKTMGRNSYVRGEYVNNFYVMQQKYDCDVLVFCSYHKTEKMIEICGWINKKELAEKGIFYKAGTTRVRDNGTTFIFRQDNYEVKNKDLRPIEELVNYI
jgi:hypothetical protein